MRILYITQWFDPEPMFKGINYVKKFQEKGHEIQVLTGFPNYPNGKLYDGYKIHLWQHEKIDGISVLPLTQHKPINEKLAELIKMDKITSMLEDNLFYIIRIYADIKLQIKSFREVLSLLLQNVTEKTNIVLGEKTTIGYDEKIFSDMKYDVPELKENDLENKKEKKVEVKGNVDESTSILAKLEDIRNDGGFLKKFNMDEGTFSFLQDNKLGKLFTV